MEAEEAEKGKEKREKEEEKIRLKEEKKQKKAEEKRIAASKAVVEAEEPVSEEDEDEANEDIDMRSNPDTEAGPSSPRHSSRSTSPPLEHVSTNPNTGLPSFPLPTGPAPPSQSLLNSQGMPLALKEAILIDDTLKVPVKELRLLEGRSRKGKEREVNLDEGVDKALVTKLEQMGIEDFFAGRCSPSLASSLLSVLDALKQVLTIYISSFPFSVQASLLPHLCSLPLNPLPSEHLHDYLISAPTGSGKTLAYGIPLIQVLQKRVVTRLRGLVVLPTRELVGQVREVLELLGKGTGLKVRARSFLPLARSSCIWRC